MDEYRDPQNEENLGSTGSDSTSYSGGESPTRDVEMSEEEPVPGCSMEEECPSADVRIREVEAVAGCSRNSGMVSITKELKSKVDYYLLTFKPVPKVCSSSTRSTGSTPTDSSSGSSSEERNKKRTKRGGRKHKNKHKKFRDDADIITPEQVIAERSERLQALRRSDGASYDEEFLKIFVNNTVESYPNGNFNLFVSHFTAPSKDSELDRMIQAGIYDEMEAGSVDVNRRDELGMTLLHRAIMNGRHLLVRRLLQIGFNINAKTEYKLTPLMMAAIWGHHRIVKQLIDARADIYYSVITGMNALHYAALYKHVEVVKLLIESGRINPNVHDANQETPLHKAATRSDNFAVVSYLVQAGADLYSVNLSNARPLDLAIIAEHDETISYLTTMTLMGSEYHLL